MRTIDIESHFTDLDRFILENNLEYERYFKFVTHILDAFTTAFQPKAGTEEYEVEIVQDFARRFLLTLRTLGLRYLFEESDRMKIDLTASGFPNHLEVRKMAADFSRMKEGRIKLVNEGTLKRQLIDKLIEGEDAPNKILQDLSVSQYYATIDKGGMFGEFVPGKLKGLKQFEDARRTRRYLYSWASYDTVTNRPFVYLLVFDNDPDPRGPETQHVTKDPEFEKVIRSCTHNTAPLKVIASDIDEAYPWIHPKVLKRIDIGPIWSEYDRTEDELAEDIGEHIPLGHFIMHVTTEVVFSVGQEKRSMGLLSKSELRQVFRIDETNKDCMERMVSEVHRYLFTTHKVLQYLNDHQKEMLKQLSTPPFICPAID